MGVGIVVGILILGFVALFAFFLIKGIVEDSSNNVPPQHEREPEEPPAPPAPTPTPTPEAKPTPEPPAPPASTPQPSVAVPINEVVENIKTPGVYLGNKNTMEIHDLSKTTPSCQIEKMNEENKVKFNSLEEAKKAIESGGYNGCRWCLEEYHAD